QVFSQDDFQLIHRLIVRQGDPSEQTPAFRKSQADQLLEAGMFASKEEYLDAVQANTTKLSAENADAEELLVVLENETLQALAEGKQLEPYMVAVPLPPELGGPKPGAVPPLNPQTGMADWPDKVPPVVLTHNDVLHVQQH